MGRLDSGFRRNGAERLSSFGVAIERMIDSGDLGS